MLKIITIVVIGIVFIMTIILIKLTKKTLGLHPLPIKEKIKKKKKRKQLRLFMWWEALKIKRKQKRYLKKKIKHQKYLAKQRLRAEKRRKKLLLKNEKRRLKLKKLALKRKNKPPKRERKWRFFEWLKNLFSKFRKKQHFVDNLSEEMEVYFDKNIYQKSQEWRWDPIILSDVQVLYELHKIDAKKELLKQKILLTSLAQGYIKQEEFNPLSLDHEFNIHKLKELDNILWKYIIQKTQVCGKVRVCHFLDIYQSNNKLKMGWSDEYQWIKT